MENWMFWTLIGCFVLWQVNSICQTYSKYKTEMLYIEDSRKMLGIVLEKSNEKNEQINRLIEILGARKD